MGDYRGEMRVVTKDVEGLLEVLADGGRRATGAVDGRGLRVAGDYLGEVGFPKGVVGVEGVHKGIGLFRTQHSLSFYAALRFEFVRITDWLMRPWIEFLLRF